MTGPPASLLFSQSFLIKTAANLNNTIHLNPLQIKEDPTKKAVNNGFFYKSILKSFRISVMISLQFFPGSPGKIRKRHRSPVILH